LGAAHFSGFGKIHLGQANPDNVTSTIFPADTIKVSDTEPTAPQYIVQFVEDIRILEALEPEWNALADDALEDSPSSESWMLLPALRLLSKTNSVKVVLVWAINTGAKSDSRTLCGVFPFQMLDRYHGLPIPTLRLWNHVYSLFPAPLLRAGSSGECIRALVTWAADGWSRPIFVEFPDLRVDSEFFSELSRVLWKDGITHYFAAVSTRAVFRRRHDADRYLRQISTMRLRRYERRLSEIGAIRYDELVRESDASSWLNEFIALEMSGWKGRSATAFGSDPDHRQWLVEVGLAAAARGKLMMLALRLDGRPIAMKLNFLADGGGYAFKTAFDETHSKYSPGILLELEHIRRLHDNPKISWMDSLAGPEHTLANRVWRDRTAVVRLLLAPGGRWRGAILALVPLLRWMKHSLRIGA